ncbi:pyrroline-5-carboxylate reductase [Sinobacterium caligoides]|uniref:Pyrroline-5-carboxylate reductase n=1 Tax=Sinobacterium caligoides TaxID=933926 RepID=A0A3N2DGK8_9GAMM|nr:pyrroline-5-carboxylate reductase [Sinobacterium caligoides]ROR98930.1 pyrroline-5-carboxylate reductase [Sinobacterium caligoides]
MSDYTIAFIGAGNMASALFGGLINQGFDADKIWAADPYPASLEQAAALGVNTTSDNHTAIAQADIVVLAVKPQVLKDVVTPLQESFATRKPLIISIVAGIEMTSLERWLGNQQAIVRCMPNTPALVRRGATGLFANPHVSEKQRRQTTEILDAVGISLWLSTESQIDAVTAISGSGPAYFFLLIEAMTEAGSKLGLDRQTAAQLTLQTALGAAEMAVSSDVDAAELRRRVTSPAGTTEAALNSFERDNFRTVVETAVKAAKQRSGELAELLGQ